MIIVLFIDYHFYTGIEKILYAASILFLISAYPEF
jgi:hypothetical protein